MLQPQHDLRRLRWPTRQRPLNNFLVALGKLGLGHNPKLRRFAGVKPAAEIPSEREGPDAAKSPRWAGIVQQLIPALTRDLAVQQFANSRLRLPLYSI